MTQLDWDILLLGSVTVGGLFITGWYCIALWHESRTAGLPRHYHRRR